MFWTMHSGIIAVMAMVFARYAAVFVPLGERGLRVTAVLIIAAISTIFIGTSLGVLGTLALIGAGARAGRR